MAVLAMVVADCTVETTPEYPQPISGIYPHLAYYNEQGECGTGAVVPWANRLWVVTYGPHLPFGSSDKLYEITPSLKRITREESIGGTPANRMIHRESGQLFIGPYAIDRERNVRAIPYDVMPGRHTGNARHLTDPANIIYYATMEEGLYEVDVHSLEVNMLYRDGNTLEKEGKTGQYGPLLPGSHGKGLYSGQGVMVYANNGEDTPEALGKFDIRAGSLCEWDGKDWTVIRRNQFVEVTGPGGLTGNGRPETDPVWVTGWDHRSLLVGARDRGRWDFYRLPIASHSYDGAHGWNTEWPRIRDVGTPRRPDYLMTMHGMFWRFPGTFTSSNTAGIRPRSAYLKVTGDFARWNGRLVFGCDDSARKEFLNKRRAKGDIRGPGQSNSNIWFTSPETPDQLGPCTAGGAVWISEKIPAGRYSEPFLFAGWDKRSVWIYNEGNEPAGFVMELDRAGDGNWSKLKTLTLEAGEALTAPFDPAEKAEWIRVLTVHPATATVHFSYADEENRGTDPDRMFAGLARIGKEQAVSGLLWGLGDNRKALGVLAGTSTDDGFRETGYYELDSSMKLVPKENPGTADFIREKMAIPEGVITIDKASVLVIDGRGRRWRLPLGDERFTGLTNRGLLRICREVATERDLFSCCGTFYELPAENADGYARIRPVASHNFRIHDYASYRGLLIMTGIQNEMTKGNEYPGGPGHSPEYQSVLNKEPGEEYGHIIRSADGKAAIWAGVIDDLWKLGKPAGQGGPWKDTGVSAGIPSDPYLIGFYDRRSLALSHDSDKPVTFTMEAEPVGHGPWMTYTELTVYPGQTSIYVFPGWFQSRWIRFTADRDCHATAWLTYR